MVFWTTKTIGHLWNEVRSCNHWDNLLGPGQCLRQLTQPQAKVTDLWNRRFGGLEEAHPPATKKQRGTSSTAVCTRPRSNVLPVCDRPDARPSSLQPVSTVISNHGNDPGAQSRSEGVLQLHCRQPERLEYPLGWREVHAIAWRFRTPRGQPGHNSAVANACWITIDSQNCRTNSASQQDRLVLRFARVVAQLQLHFIAKQGLNPLRHLQKDSIHPLGRFGELFEQPWRCENDLQLRTSRSRLPNRHAGANAEGPSTVVGAAHFQRIRLSTRHGHWLGAAASHCHTHEETVHIDMKENGTLRGRVCGAAFLMSNLLRNNSFMKCLKRARHEPMRLCLSSKSTFLVFWPHTRSRAGCPLCCSDAKAVETDLWMISALASAARLRPRRSLSLPWGTH